jgi:transcriptional regulator with XRE-family HTH domain
MTPFATDLRFCREAVGLSLSAAARKAGITKAHLHDMESGRSLNPCISTLAGLAKAYGQPLGWMAERAALSHAATAREASAEHLSPPSSEGEGSRDAPLSNLTASTAGGGSSCTDSGGSPPAAAKSDGLCKSEGEP